LSLKQFECVCKLPVQSIEVCPIVFRRACLILTPESRPFKQDRCRKILHPVAVAHWWYQNTAAPVEEYDDVD